MDGAAADERPAAGRVVLMAAACVAVVPVAAALLLRQIAVATTWVVAFVAAAPFVPLAGLVALSLFLLARSWTGASVATALTVVLLVTQVPLYFGASAPPGATGLKVMTINLLHGGGHATDIVETVRRDGVELLSVQELDHEALAALRAVGLDDVLPHSVARPARGTGGNGLWSRAPLQRLAGPESFTHPPVAAALDLGGRTVLVAAVHVVSPYSNTAARWSAELDELARWLGDVEGPAVFAGDFNATLDHPQYRNLVASGFRDAAEQAGAGYLPTFPANRRGVPPLITIDHVVVGGGVVATAVRRHTIGGTDHEALVATLAVP